MDEILSRRQATEYVADVLERTHALENIARKLALSEDYVNEEVPKLINKYAAAAGIMRTAVLEQFSQYLRTRKSSDLTLLRSFDKRIQDLVLDIRLPERARSDRVPGVLTRLVARKAEEIRPGAGVILRPQWRYNYKIYRDDIQTRYRNFFASIFPTRVAIDEWLDGLPNPLYIISFPLVEQRSIHMHALLGHELGHLIAREYTAPQAETERFEKDLRRERLKYVRQQRPDLKSLTDQEILESDFELDRAIAARRAALKEYASDAAAVFLIGVPALLATAQLALSRHLWQSREAEGGTYPTWGNRLFYMFDAAQEAGWFDAFKRTKGLDKRSRQAIRAITQQLSAIRTWVGSAPRWNVADNAVRKGHDAAATLLPYVRNFISSRFSRCIANPGQVLGALPVLLERLGRSLPPDNLHASEIPFMPASLEQIFLASWAQRLLAPMPIFEAGDLSSSTRDATEQLKRLTFKAIENVDFFQRFHPLLDGEGAGSGRANSKQAREQTTATRKKETRRNSPVKRRPNR